MFSVSDSNFLPSVARRLGAACVLAMSCSTTQAAANTESWLGLPVTYASHSYALHPWPALEVKDIKVLTSDAITVKRAWVTPDWADWITEFRMTRVRLQVEDMVATPSALARLGLIDGASTKKVSSVRFNKLKLLIGAGAIDLPAGEMEFAADGTLARVKLQFADKLSAEASPKDGKLAVLIQTTGQWKWDKLPAFIFDNIAAQGLMSNDEILLDKIGANGDGGAVTGSIKFAVPEKYTMDGEIKMNSLRAQDILSRVQARHTVNGILYGSVKVSSTADSFEQLGTTLATTGTYSLRSGAIDRFGLLEGLRKVQAGPAGGGLTRFDRLEGGFSSGTGKPTSVNIRNLDAGALQGSGSFTVAPDGQLKGSIASAMRIPNGDSMSRTLSLTGRVEAPTLIVR